MKKSKNAAATMIRAGCLLLDQAYRDNEKRMSAKIPLPISSRSVGSVGDADIFFAFLLAIPDFSRPWLREQVGQSFSPSLPYSWVVASQEC